MSQFSMITAISFDGDETLWDFERVMRRSLGCVLEELRAHVADEQLSQLTIEKMIHIRDSAANELKGQEVNLGKIRLIAFQRTLEYIGINNDELAGYLNEIYLKHRHEKVELYPDVVNTLDVLAKQFKIGILSNGNTYPEKCGMAKYFSFVVFAQDHGVAKPDKEFFEIALEKAGCSHDELLHVGDSLEDDIRGAKNAGIKTVWLNRNKENNGSSVKPDHEINSLNELQYVLDASK